MSKRVVIIGAGFGGLFAAKTLADKPVEVLLIDRNNFHTFTPLIYQVATCALDPSEVAYPVRSIFHKASNLRFLLGEVTAIDCDEKKIKVQVDGVERVENFDFLIVAAGSTVTYFKNERFATHSFELNTLPDAVQLRNHILKLFERAAWTQDYSQRDAMTTIVVVGGGPTGLETAGAIYELYNYVLEKEYRVTGMRAQVLLIEMLDHVLNAYPPGLQKSARKQLESLGVKVMLGRRVDLVEKDRIILDDGTRIPTHTLIWAAGVRANPLSEMLDVELKQGGRIPIEPTCAVIGRENIFAVGDNAYLEDGSGEPYPMLIPVAQQQGVLAAKNILRKLENQPHETFTYNDRGIMATIGRRRAVAWIFNRIRLSGFPAWLAWLGLHIITLIGFRNKLNVLINWMWNYFTYDRSVRIILERSPYEEIEKDSP